MNPKARTKTNKPNKSFPIVGIGASAGGLHSLECFLSALPKKFGFALVFLQHLSPKHKSLLPDLVRSRNPHLESEELSDGTRARPGKLYLCPPAKEIGIQNGIFSVSHHAKEHIHLPIDEFFISLAEDAEENAIAVIFSGAGTDGARGIQTIKAMGGTVLVQDPATAEFNGMPLAAINTGQVDSVLSPDDIAREIVKMHETGKASVSPDSLLTPAQFETFFRLIHQKTGLRFNHYKKNVVSRRIRRRMYLHGISSVQDYAQLISGENTEAELLASDLMIGVTSFFRDRVAWKALTLDVVRKLVAENSDAPIRVWSPACATGEEPYSIAMLLTQELRRADKKREIQVFATDVNDRALEKARQGTYPASIAADLAPDYLKQFFTSSEDKQNVIVNKEIRELVVFAKQNLLNDPPFSRLDLIICRNLLIYLEPEAQNKCIDLFHYALKDGGYLFLGNAESTGSGKNLFKSLGHKKCRVYRKIETKPAGRMPFTVPFAAERTASPPGKRPQAEEFRRSTAELIQESLLGEYAPTAIAINQHYDILYHNGPTSRYLRQPRGTPTQNLLELLPENLRNRVRGGLYRSAQAVKPVSIRLSIAGDDDRTRPVTLRISKLHEDLFLVIFREKGGPVDQPGTVDLDAAAVEDPAVRQLEAELSTTKQELQSHIEQLKGLNEEFQSSNEELQAANEELETSREELQSLNEELLTVNTQLQTKVEEQEETNNDLNNFLTSTSIPTLFLDPEFKVKRFTPAMSRLVKLIPTDVGRQIIDMSQESLGPDLVSESQSVLDTLVPVKKETAINGTTYIRAILPYRTADNRIEGVVITYNDVTDLKRSEERTKHLASFPQLNPNPVIETDSSGRILYCNPAAEKVLRDLGMEGDACNAFLPVDAHDLFSDLEKKKEATLYREIRIQDRVFGETIQLIPGFNALRVYAFEITRRKQAEEKLTLAKEEWERTFDSVPDMIAIIDNQHRVRRVNRAMAQRLGRTPEQCVGLSCYEAVHGTSMPHEFCPHALTLKDQKLHIQEVHEGRLGGDFLVSTTPLHDAQGRLVGSVHVAHDITERKQWETTLQESEQRVRRKLESLLSPEGDIGNLELGDIIDAPAIQTLMERFYELARIPMAVIDLKGKVLVGVGWQDICTKFHRAHPETCGHCIESDTQLTAGVPAGEYKLYKCKNNMWDVATPIEVGGKHIGHFFTGQFFFEDESPDYELFREQAKQYGFDEQEYVTALDSVPRLSRAAVDTAMGFFMKLSGIISHLSYSNIKLARILAERDMLMASLQETQQQNEFLANIVRHSDQPFGQGFPDGRLGLINKAFEQLTGYSEDELRSMDWARVLTPPEWQESEKEKLEELHHTGKPVRYEKEYIRKDGTRVPIELLVHLVTDSEGNPLYYYSFLTDITERKRAEEALRQSEEKFAKAFAGNPSAIALTRLEDGLFLEVNDTWVALTGYSREEVIGRSAREMKIWSTPEAAARFVQTLRDNGSLHGWEEPFLKKSGKSYVAMLSAQILHMRGEQVVLSTLVDITERKLSEEALRKANDRLEMALRASNAGTWDWDVATGRIKWSRELFVLFGLDPAKDAATFEFWDTVLHPDDREEAGVRIDRALKDKTPLDSEYRIVKPDGQISWIHALGVGQYDHQNRPVRMTGLCIDVTKRKQAEEQIQKHLADLRANNEELERLNRVMVGRELRMVELKKEINELCSKTGETLRYNLDFEKE